MTVGNERCVWWRMRRLHLEVWSSVCSGKGKERDSSGSREVRNARL